ncbi:MAG: hypothetical protein WCZ90_11905 [Melioribacteraceae bacterium]
MMNENGSANIVWKFTVEENTSNELLFPWNFSSKNLADIKFSLYKVGKSKTNTDSLIQFSAAYNPSIVDRDGIKFISLKIDQAEQSKSRLIKFTVKDFIEFPKDNNEEYGNYPVKYRYINTSFPQIKRFESTLVLPAGFVIVSVDETIPKQTEDNPVSPFQLGVVDSKNSITLKVQNMKLGEHAFLKLNVKREAKSYLVLFAFGAAGLLYLFFFRDLVTQKNGNGNGISDKTKN